jgi:sodium/potassium-transporting ATPase subunit alpha
LESRNIALQGTLCTSGSGIGVCVGWGDGTVFGRITKDIARERPAPTTLEAEIRRLVAIIASLAIGVAILIASKQIVFLMPEFVEIQHSM